MDDVEHIAAEVLRAAGSNLNHYTPQNREKIISATTAAIAAMPRNEDYMKGWRDALRLAVSVEVTPFYATNAMPNPKNLPTPPQQGGENAP